ncbi:MAG: hypothetical protein IIB33_06065 [Chloroflexi bacterium]|nr:hypothetical protein [Chloroflexota bacterium]
MVYWLEYLADSWRTGMRIAPNSISGRRLRQHGVSSKALRKSRVYFVFWQPVDAIMLPVPFFGAVVLIRRLLVERDVDGELPDGPVLALLVHQLCHVHQRLEWGLYLYLWRHLWQRLVTRGIPIQRRQVERECHYLVRQVEEHYAELQETQEPVEA